MLPAPNPQQALTDRQIRQIEALTALVTAAQQAVAVQPTPEAQQVLVALDAQKTALDGLVAGQQNALRTAQLLAQPALIVQQQQALDALVAQQQLALADQAVVPQAALAEVRRIAQVAQQPVQQPVVQPPQPVQPAQQVPAPPQLVQQTVAPLPAFGPERQPPDTQAVNEVLRQIQYKAIFKELQDAQKAQTTALTEPVAAEALHNTLRNLFQQKKQVAEEAIDEEIAAAFPEPRLGELAQDPDGFKTQQEAYKKAIADRAKAMADYKKAFLAEQRILREAIMLPDVVARDELERLLPAAEYPLIASTQNAAIIEIRALCAQHALAKADKKNEILQKIEAEKTKFNEAIENSRDADIEKERIKRAFGKQVEAIKGKEVLVSLLDADQRQLLQDEARAADEVIRAFKLKYGAHSELPRVIREVVASRADLKAKVAVSRALDEGLGNGLPEEIRDKFKYNAEDLAAPDANAAKDAQDKYKNDVEKQKKDREAIEKDLTGLLRMPGAQPKSIEALFEAQLINSLEELKEIEPFQQYKDAPDFVERARKVFLDAGIVARKQILEDLASKLRLIVKHDGTKGGLEAEAIQAGELGAEVLNVVIERKKYTEAREGNEPDDKKARLLRVMKSLVMYGGDRAKPASIFNEETLKSDILYIPGTLKNEDIEKQQKALIKAVKELKEDHDKQMAKVFGAPDEVKKNKEDLEKKLQQDIIEKEKNLLVDHGFVPVRGADGKGVAGLYCCSREGDDKTVYTVRGGHGTDFIQQIDAIILDNRSRIDENGDQVEVGRCTFINIDQKDKERAIIECLKQNSECSFKSKPEHVGVPHPCSVVLTAINAITPVKQSLEAINQPGYTANKNAAEAFALCFPAIDALNKMKSYAGWWGKAKAHMASTNKRNFLEYTKGDGHAVGEKIKKDIENIITILGDDEYPEVMRETARKAAKIMQGMIKGSKVDTYNAYSTRLEASLDDLEKREKDKARHGIKLE